MVASSGQVENESTVQWDTLVWGTQLASELASVRVRLARAKGAFFTYHTLRFTSKFRSLCVSRSSRVMPAYDHRRLKSCEVVDSNATSGEVAPAGTTPVNDSGAAESGYWLVGAPCHNESTGLCLSHLLCSRGKGSPA